MGKLTTTQTFANNAKNVKKNSTKGVLKAIGLTAMLGLGALHMQGCKPITADQFDTTKIENTNMQPQEPTDFETPEKTAINESAAMEQIRSLKPVIVRTHFINNNSVAGCETKDGDVYYFDLSNDQQIEFNEKYHTQNPYQSRDGIIRTFNKKTGQFDTTLDLTKFLAMHPEFINNSEIKKLMKNNKILMGGDISDINDICAIGVNGETIFFTEGGDSFTHENYAVMFFEKKDGGKQLDCVGSWGNVGSSLTITRKDFVPHTENGIKRELHIVERNENNEPTAKPSISLIVDLNYILEGRQNEKVTTSVLCTPDYYEYLYSSYNPEKTNTISTEAETISDREQY